MVGTLFPGGGEQLCIRKGTSRLRSELTGAKIIGCILEKPEQSTRSEDGSRIQLFRTSEPVVIAAIMISSQDPENKDQQARLDARSLY